MMDQANRHAGRFMLQVDNYEKHREMIERGPYIRQMDLALTCCEVLLDFGSDLISVKVTWEMLEHMDISPERLFELAAENCRNWLPAQVSRLDEVLMGLRRQIMEEAGGESADAACLTAGEESADDFAISAGDMPVYTLTNQRCIKGAAALFYTDAAKDLADLLQSDLILLPSSIHEWIILPEDAGISCADAAKMVREINAAIVDEKDFLSDHIYRYVRDKNDIEIIADV